jgi:hypothetical protein
MIINKSHEDAGYGAAVMAAAATVAGIIAATFDGCPAGVRAALPDRDAEWHADVYVGPYTVRVIGAPDTSTTVAESVEIHVLWSDTGRPATCGPTGTDANTDAGEFCTWLAYTDGMDIVVPPPAGRLFV